MSQSFIEPLAYVQLPAEVLVVSHYPRYSFGAVNIHCKRGRLSLLKDGEQVGISGQIRWDGEKYLVVGTDCRFAVVETAFSVVDHDERMSPRVKRIKAVPTVSRFFATIREQSGNNKSNVFANIREHAPTPRLLREDGQSANQAGWPERS